jgi:hypothetical protein
MKKLLALIAVALLLASPFAFATKATQASLGSGISQVNGIGDLSSGDTAEVDTSGNLAVEIKNDSNTAAVDSSGNLAIELFDGTNQVNVDSSGSLEVKERTKSFAYGAADGQIGSAAATVYSIALCGNASSAAGDYAYVYDGTSATGEPVLECSIDVAKGSQQFLFPAGITFSKRCLH